MAETITWATVDQVAAELGAGEPARRKWRQHGRGVPPAWRIKIAERLASGGQEIAFSAFDALPHAPGRIAA